MRMIDDGLWNAWKGFTRVTVGKNTIENNKSCMTGMPIGTRLARKKKEKNDGRSQMKICSINWKMILGSDTDSKKKKIFKTKRKGPKSSIGRDSSQTRSVSSQRGKGKVQSEFPIGNGSVLPRDCPGHINTEGYGMKVVSIAFNTTKVVSEEGIIEKINSETS